MRGPKPILMPARSAQLGGQDKDLIAAVVDGRVTQVRAPLPSWRINDRPCADVNTQLRLNELVRTRRICVLADGSVEEATR